MSPLILAFHAIQFSKNPDNKASSQAMLSEARIHFKGSSTGKKANLPHGIGVLGVFLQMPRNVKT